jgi:preprotein translocase subunit Sec63
VVNKEQETSTGRKTNVMRMLTVVLAFLALCTTILCVGSLLFRLKNRFLRQNGVVNNCWHGPYSVLNLEKSDNDVSTIKRAFYKVARQYHPDRNQGNCDDSQLATTTFVTIVQAYKTLTDPEERERHERYHCRNAGREWPPEEMLLVPLNRTLLLFGCFLVVVTTGLASVILFLPRRDCSAPSQKGGSQASAIRSHFE